MAYIIGLVTPEEEAELTRRGWEVEPAPGVDFDTGTAWRYPNRMRMVWVDQDMFKIMDGPDWDKGDPEKQGEGRIGDTRCELWWNSLTPEERTQVLGKGPAQSSEQVQLFSNRLWHELHGWMRDELRPLRQKIGGGPWQRRFKPYHKLTLNLVSTS